MVSFPTDLNQMFLPDDLSNLHSQALLYFALPCLAWPYGVLCGIPLSKKSDPPRIVTLCCVMCSSCSHGANNPGSDSQSCLHDFAVMYMKYDPDDVTKSIKQMIYRASKEVQTYNSAGSNAHRRQRRLGLQGHPTSPNLELGLLEWWADHRDAVSTRLWTRDLVRSGLAIRTRIINMCERMSRETPVLPKVTQGWVRSFCKRHHISLKQGTVRYKVSFAKVKRRTRRCWLNSIRVRYAFQLMYGADRLKKSLPDQPYLHVSDQKPMHFNEAESKGKGTLDWKGIPCKALKSDVAGSRARLSPNTHMQNDPWSQPPIECTFKLKTARCLNALVIPPHVNMSLQHSESGSYDADGILRYLRRWAQPWTEERKKNHDIRNLLIRVPRHFANDLINSLIH